MKAKSLLAIALALAASAGWATDFVWTGKSTAVDKTWADAANWTVDDKPTDTWPKTADDTATFNTPCVPVRNEEATVGEIILNADVTLRFDKWLTVGKISGNGELILMNRGRLRNISGTSLTCNNNIRITSSDSTNCGNHLAMPLIQANGANFTISGSLKGDGHVFLTMYQTYGVVLAGDNSEFSGTVHIDSNTSNHMRFASADAGSTNATWILHGNTGDNGTVTFTDGGTIKFGSFKADARTTGNYPWRFKELGTFATVEIGHLNAEDDIISVRMGEDKSNTGMAKIRKVGTGTLELWHTGHQYGTEIAGGTVLATSVDALNGRTDSNTEAFRDESTICFTGGTLKYGTDEWTVANNPVAVTTDWSGLVKNSTGFISVDTGTNEVTWASEGLYTNNTDTKGVVKKGSGVWRLTGTNREGSWQLFTFSARTNIVEEGTLEIMNSKYNSRYTISSKILGTGTLRILSSEHDGAVWLEGKDAFADFAGTLEWANDITEASYASGFRMTGLNFEMPNARMRVTGNPAEPTCVMKCETAYNPDSAHVTVGAFDHLHPNAEIRCDRSAWTLNILGTAGDSYLNGAFTTNTVSIVKTGPGKLTIGPGFSALEGSAVNVNEGALVVESGATIPGTLTIANGARLSGSGSCSTLTLASGAIVDLGITADTDIATTPTGIVSAAKPDLTGATLANASANSKGTWQLVAQQNGAGAYVLTATFVSHGMIVTLDGKETGIDDAEFSNWLTTSGWTPETKDALVTSNANGISPLVAYMLGYETYDEATSVAPRMTAQTTSNVVKLDFASYGNARKDFLGSANLQCYLMTSDDNVNWEKTPVGLLPAEVEFTSASLYTKLGVEVVGDTAMVTNLVGAEARDQSELEWDNYQYHVAVTGITSKETGNNPMAHLWIPEEIKDGGTVEGIVFGMHNMLEEPIFAHPDFRREIAAANMAILWVTPMIVQDASLTALTETETSAITTMFADLATASGHAELATASVTVIGHSALGTFPFEFAAQFKERTRLAMSVKGDWPESNRDSWSVFKEVAANGTPMLCVSGEYEDGYRRKKVGVSSLLAAVPGADFHAWVDVGGGHFDWSDELCRALGRYITTPAKRDAIIAAYEALPRGVGGFTVLGVKTNGVALAQNKDLHLQILFDMKGSEVVDGYEFELEPFFEDTVPEGRPVGWTGLTAGSANPKPSAANAADKLVIQKISGPVEHISGNWWRIKYCSLYDTAGYRSGEAVFQIIYPGDDDFKRCVQQFQINVKRP